MSNAVSIAVRQRESDCRMRPTWMWTADAKRTWWSSLAASAVLGVPACAGSVDVRAVEHALIAKVGPPLPDARVVGTPWYQGVGVWYDHRNDAPRVLAWLEAIPARQPGDRVPSYYSWKPAGDAPGGGLIMVTSDIPSLRPPQRGGPTVARPTDGYSLILAVPEETISRAWLGLLPGLGLAAAIRAHDRRVHAVPRSPCGPPTSPARVARPWQPEKMPCWPESPPAAPWRKSSRWWWTWSRIGCLERWRPSC